MAKTIKVQIQKGDPTSCNLVLKDGNVVSANPGDYVEWDILPSSGVKQILNIIVDAGSHNVFDEKPGPVPGSTSWKGRIDPNLQFPPSNEIDESYTIEWSTAASGWLNEGEGRVCEFDPLIRVRPKTA